MYSKGPTPFLDQIGYLSVVILVLVGRMRVNNIPYTIDKCFPLVLG